MRAHRVVLTLITLLVLIAPSAFARAPLPMPDAARVKAFEAQILAVHNKLRAKHGVPPMKWDAAVANYAKSRANLVSQRDGLSHGHAGLQDHGENLYWGATSGALPGGEKAAAAAVESWYNEIKDYNFSNPGFSSTTGHFTQVVWKNSTRLGCAIVQGKGARWFETYVVCNYVVPGNMMGDFPANVLPPKR
ncbi:CAP family protein [Archangium lipolyticum]|uniref:CAP family protein n=1 Tax=Archangium lipolyticum TaxID=2970465 RepID=UPI002149B531|nr:CAP family protein [Archangium lipolyticum]